jgi:hypothetical protein
MKALLTFAKVPCITAGLGIGRPPLCPAGTPAGTAIEVFPSSVCEPEWAYPNLVDELVISRLVAGRPELYAIYRRPPGTGLFAPLFPSGSIVAVFRDRAITANTVIGAGKAVTIENGRIVSTVFGCGSTAVDKFLGEPNVRTWIVEPAP